MGERQICHAGRTKVRNFITAAAGENAERQEGEEEEEREVGGVLLFKETGICPPACSGDTGLEALLGPQGVWMLTVWSSCLCSNSDSILYTHGYPGGWRSPHPSTRGTWPLWVFS